MKVALVIERMDLARGGRERSTAQMAEMLAARGHEVTILCQSGSWEAPGVTLRALGRRGVRRTVRLRNFVADVRGAAGDFDIVHATLPVPGADVYQPRGGSVPQQAVVSRLRRGRVLGPISAGLRRTKASYRLASELERQVAADANTWIVPGSQLVADEFARHYGRTDRVRVVFNAVELPEVSKAQRADWRQEVRYRMGCTQQDVIFLTVATNYELKGVDHQIRHVAKWAMRKPSLPDARMVIAGRDVPEGYRRVAGLQGIGRMTTFAGKQDNIWRLYAAADVVLLLSWYDACSRVVLEGLRWGIPAITTSLNGAAEALGDGAGIVIDSPRDGAGLHAALDAMMDADTRAAASAACEEIAPSLGMERHIEELEAVYGEIVRSKR